MEKTMSDVTLACPDCGSDNVHIVIGEASGRAIFADEVFDDRDDAMCGDCHHKEQAAAFISVAGYPTTTQSAFRPATQAVQAEGIFTGVTDMLKGLAITPPVLGRISIGKVVEKAGKRLPEKDDQFTITSQVQGKDGWVPHPFDEALRKEQGSKIRSIPIQLLFNDPELNFRAEYSLFDRNTGRPLCVGNGESCKRHSEDGIKSLPCPSPDGCPLAKGNACKPYGRLNVSIGDDDPLGSFIFRTTGFNSIRTLVARLQYFQAISGDRLSCLPLELRLRGKSTRQSHGAPIFYVDITPRNGMSVAEMLAEARRKEADRQLDGFDQAALEAAARLGFGNGAFEDSEEEGETIVEEYFSSDDKVESTEALSAAAPKLASLVDRLGERMAVADAEKSAEG